ncbi:protein indeterminate-domain 16-like [Oryza glaberrima]|uniref:C2H2-type domain-containing protein n=1 Tax=Oryza glaberrima TaxID=4538 RepID=I1P996_ORYGL|nr:protein indeterminate-domain 16-like [Oryza glaberrima]
MALVKSHHQMLASSSTSSSSPSSQQQQPPPPASNSSSLAAAAADQPSPAKRKRRPPGTPDPDAEVVALSPRTLLESDRYVCEICGQGFQREQNLQMHRRRHKVPWRLVKRPAAATAAEDGGAAGGGGGAGGGAGGGGARKRVFVCPEPSCLHHDPAHALGDLVGIKKHFRRKHGGRRQWVCARCAKGYAVQSDYKAHLKTCGTRGHSCDCGRVFSRVESFIEHQDACNSGRVCGEVVPVATTLPVIRPAALRHHHHHPPPPPPELQLLPASTTAPLAAAFSSNSTTTGSSSHEQHATTMTTTKLQLSIGPAAVVAAASGGGGACAAAAGGEEEEQQREEVRRALEEKTAADAARERAREEAAAAERALEDARRARHRARGELEKALALRDHAARLIAQVTCHACRQRSLAVMSMAAVDGHGASAVAREHLRGGGVGAGI